MEWPSYQDEFKIEVLSCSETRITCHDRSPSASSASSIFSLDGHGSFSFCAAHLQPQHLPIPCAYADEIFQNGKIRPLHSQPFQALTLYAPLPHVETIHVHEVVEPCYPSSAAHTPSRTHAHDSPLHYPSSSEPARATSLQSDASLSHTRHRHSPHTPPTHTNDLSHATPYHQASDTHAHHQYHAHHTSPPWHERCSVELPRATAQSHHHASHLPHQTFESARVPLRLSLAAKCRRALSFLPLRRVCHVNEDEISCPSSRDSFTPVELKDKILLKCHSTTHMSNMKKLHSYFPTTQAARSQNASCVGHKHSVSQGKGAYRKLQSEEPPPNILPRVLYNSPSPPSPHAIHYNAQRAHKESMKRRTSLPYHHGFLACIGY